MNKLSKLNHGLCMAETTEGKYKLKVCVDRCEGIVPCHLYLVVHTRKVKEFHPITSMAYCIAPNEEEAIEQTLATAVPEYGYYSRGEGVESTATRIPCLVRGWGNEAF